MTKRDGGTPRSEGAGAGKLEDWGKEPMPRQMSSPKLSRRKSVLYNFEKCRIDQEYLSTIRSTKGGRAVPPRSFTSLTNDASLADVMKRLSTAHIVGLLKGGDEDRCDRVVGQSDVFRVVKGALSSETVTVGDLLALGFGSNTPISLTTEATAAEVFGLMAEKHISSIAVVDADDGNVVLNTSSRYIRRWFIEDHDYERDPITLDQPIEDFFSQINRKRSSDKSGSFRINERYPVVTIGPAATLAKAIGKFDATGYHRVFVIDEQRRPIGVLSVTDIFRFVTSNPEDWGQRLG